MKIYIYGVWLSLLILLMACDRNEDLKVLSPDFNVRVASETYRAGDTVRFLLEGDADLITFYSGEPWSLQASFASQVRFGSQPDQLTFMASSDYNGESTEASVNAATWTNITERFDLAINASQRPSGIQNIKDLLVTGQQLYLAFRYVGQPAPAQRNWWINDFKVDIVTPSVVTNVLTHTEVDWKFVNFGGNAQGAGWGWSADGAGGRILFDPNGSTSYTEGWAIADALDAGLLEPAGVPIKAMIEPMMPSYEYIFHDPGTYRVRFEAANTSILGIERIFRTVDVTIEP